MANLSKLRRIVSVTVFCLLTFYFLDFAGILPAEFHVLGQIQFIPALISGSVVIVACIVVLTLLFGRLYCSSICPLGTFQDAFHRKAPHRKNHLALRLSILAACIVLFFSGFTLIIGLLDPYGVYGKIATHIFKPAYMFLNNILAFVFNHFGNYTFYRTETGILSLLSLITAAAFIALFIFANKRFYCNTICPVGTILGLLNKYSLFKIRLNKSQCISCGACEKKCKAACIDSKAKTIDYSRCVNCFNCINACNRKGISYTMSKPEKQAPVDMNKRQFLAAGAFSFVVVPAALTHAKVKAFFEDRNHQNAISPPGAVSEEHLLRHCTSCHLCVSKCPSKVLKPAFMEYGIDGIMVPRMYFEKGFCNFDCTLCADVCPNNALLPLTKEEKHRLQVGKVVFEPELCVVHTEGWNCGACSEHCPTQAVKMIPYKNGLTIPLIDADICVGCGGCEFICPVRPERAIYVKGNKVHRQAKAFSVEEKDEKEITDFGF